MSMLDAVERVKVIYAGIADAALTAHRDPSEVSMVAVSKGQPVEAIKELVMINVVTFGENRIQEALPKIEAFTDNPLVSFHFIGRLQVNKAKQAVDNFSLIHSVDRLELASELQKQAAKKGIKQNILIQVNLAGEEQKGGISRDALRGLYDEVIQMPNITVKGFMMIPPLDEIPENNRGLFRNMRAIFDVYKKENNDIDILSMGMSHDYRVAVEEGATMVRIGTALFGQRG